MIEYDPRPLPTELIKPTSSNPSTSTTLPPLPTLLKRFVLRSKVKVQDVSNEWEAWSIWGGEAERVGEKRREKVWTGWKWGVTSSAVEPSWLGTRYPDIRLVLTPADEKNLPYKSGEGTGLWDWRAPGMGRRVVLPKTIKRVLNFFK